jgi:hypothetical protein
MRQVQRLTVIALKKSDAQFVEPVTKRAQTRNDE